MISNTSIQIFNKAIGEYHRFDNIDQPAENPFTQGNIEFLLYEKCWIDTAQWHMEDVVRQPDIDPKVGLYWKRRIDKQNQLRTDTVEFIDSYFLQQYKDVQPLPQATINTETPAWAIDRLSILCLKIYHMRLEAERLTATESHRKQSVEKLNILLTQQKDLAQSIDELLTDIEQGKKYMKVYKQLKMYNDPNLNPILYKK